MSQTAVSSLFTQIFEQVRLANGPLLLLEGMVDDQDKETAPLGLVLEVTPELVSSLEDKQALLGSAELLGMAFKVKGAFAWLAPRNEEDIENDDILNFSEPHWSLISSHQDCFNLKELDEVSSVQTVSFDIADLKSVLEGKAIDRYGAHFDQEHNLHVLASYSGEPIVCLERAKEGDFVLHARSIVLC